MTIAGGWIALVVVVYWFALPPLVECAAAAVVRRPRLLAIVALTALLGFPMGIPFPSLMRLAGAGERQRQQIALLWAINGAFSVLGSTLAWSFRCSGASNGRC